MDQKKLIFRVKNKADAEKLSINSQVYFIAETAVYVLSDLIRRKSSLMMAWLEEETLHTKVLYEPQGVSTINRVLTQREKEVMLFMISDGTVVIASSKDPKGSTPQIIKQQAK